jgi:EAL domain-containing protein (putative c-di-GMP-specific phosphodiesterase class I)
MPEGNTDPLSMGMLNVLVVEAYDLQRHAVVRMISALGATSVSEAGDGETALGILADPARTIDIVVTDLDLPGMDGMEFLRHLGESGARVSIILTSALERNLSESVENMTRAYGLRLLGMMQKPLSQDRVRGVILRHDPARLRQAGGVTGGGRFDIAEIRAGLGRDEFMPYLQPKVALDTRQCRGVEALARWRHPERGLVGPDAFVALLEEQGGINELMWVILKKSAACCRAWRNGGLEASVSVNLSLASLGEPDLADSVTRIVTEEGVAPDSVVFELTESAATTNVGRALENLARLRMRGFGLSIDNYGTGYSSMQQLARIAFTELKVDRSYVRSAGRQDRARVVLESALEMARNLGLASVAEGVETESDWVLLRHLGCTLAQGYFIARPMPAHEFPDWVGAWERDE